MCVKKMRKVSAILSPKVEACGLWMQMTGCGASALSSRSIQRNSSDEPSVCGRSIHGVTLGYLAARKKKSVLVCMQYCCEVYRFSLFAVLRFSGVLVVRAADSTEVRDLLSRGCKDFRNQ